LRPKLIHKIDPKDAIEVCIDKLDDLQLAMVIAR
jgi:hypothetical protein